MNSNRLQDQVLILGGIKQVKKELEAHDPEAWIAQGEILLRLITLYSLLDIDRLAYLCLAADDRKEDKAA
jgi:hypothetical protein